MLEKATHWYNTDWNLPRIGVLRPALLFPLLCLWTLVETVNQWTPNMHLVYLHNWWLANDGDLYPFMIGSNVSSSRFSFNIWKTEMKPHSFWKWENGRAYVLNHYNFKTSRQFFICITQNIRLLSNCLLGSSQLFRLFLHSTRIFKRLVGENQNVMIIKLLKPCNLIGCGGESQPIRLFMEITGGVREYNGCKR